MSENFVIDLTGCATTVEIINSISVALEIPDAAGKSIVLKLKDFQLNQSQLLSIKSLISTYNSTLYGVETTSLITKQLCENMGLKILNQEPKKEEEFREIAQDKNIFDELSKDFIEETNYNLTSEDTETQNIPEETQEEQTSEKTSFETPKEFYAKEEFCLNDDFMQSDSSIKDEEFDKPKTEFQTYDKEFEELSRQQETGAQLMIEELEETVKEEGDREEIEGERKVISVYTKASEESKEAYEEVDFYAPPTDEPVVVDNKQTMYVNQTLRSGQVIEYDGNVVIIGDCHPGSEVKAAGDITVWGILGSIAHAGVNGNTEAKIRALNMHAVQLRIADCYSRRPDGTNIPYIVRSSTCTPEEARIVDNNIVLYKINS